MASSIYGMALRYGFDRSDYHRGMAYALMRLESYDESVNEYDLAISP